MCCHCHDEGRSNPTLRTKPWCTAPKFTVPRKHMQVLNIQQDFAHITVTKDEIYTAAIILPNVLSRVSIWLRFVRMKTFTKENKILIYTNILFICMCQSAFIIQKLCNFAMMLSMFKFSTEQRNKLLLMQYYCFSLW